MLKGELPPDLATKDFGVRKVLFEGVAYRYSQEFAPAEKKLTEAEHLASSHQPQLLCEVLNARGALEIDEKKFASADETLHQALALSRRLGNSRQEASILLNLALVATSQERYDEAIDLSQAALQLSRSLRMQSLVATILGNLGWAYFQLGDFNNALEFYKEGAEQSERSGLSGYTAYWFTGVANTYVMLRDYRSAEELAKSTLQRARSLNDAETITASLNALAEITLRLGRPDEAERYNQEAIQMEEKGLDHFGVQESLLLSGRIEMGKRHFGQAEKVFLRVMQDPGIETPLKWEVKARLATLHDAEGLTVKAEQEYQEAIKTIEKAQELIDRTDLRLSYLAGGIEFYDDYIDFLIRHKRPTDALRIAELSRARTLAEGLSKDAKTSSRYFPSVRPEVIAKRMQSTLLFYWLGEKQSYLWVIAPAKTTYFTLPQSAEIEPVVKSYRKAILGMRDAQGEGSSDGKKLYAMLVEPARELIPKGSRVILLPAESLYGLNFETLVVPDPQPHFWIEDVTLTTANSLTLLASSATRPKPKEKSLLLVGNTEPNASFPALAQAPVEIQRIEQYFPEQNRKVLEGKSATPTAYLSSSPEKFAYLHFVTHGTASITRPLESAVILSSEGDSYKLYARDIVKHRLNAHLVTISACDGLGKRTYSGEGLVGLSWAFLRAGAHNVIGALWEVSDASTPQLMDALYGGLSQGKDPATALRDAKLSLLHANSDTVFKKPFYWAPFQLYAGS